MKIKIRTYIYILILSLCMPFFAQSQCDFPANTPFSLNIDNQNIASGFTVKYLLTNDIGNIVQIKDTPSFNGVSDGLYVAYNVVYLQASVVSGLSIGQNVNDIKGNSLDISPPFIISICTCNGICDFTSSQPININATVSSTPSYLVIKYFLTDEVGKILLIGNTPSFPNQLPGNYLVYSIIYTTEFGIAGLSVGSYVSNINGVCYDLESLAINVCADTPTTCSFFESQTVSIPSLELGTIGGYTIRYVLTNKTGEILAINTSPSFGLLSNNVYQVITIKYLSNSQVFGLQVSSPISTVYGTSVNLSSPYTFRVCRNNILGANVCVNNPFTLNATSGVSFNWTGPNGFTATGATITRNNATIPMGGVYSVTITDTYGCTAIQTTNVAVNPLPTATLTTATICAGESKILTPTGLSNAASFLWSNGATTSTISVSPNLTTRFTLTVTSGASCIVINNVWVEVNPLPAAEVIVVNAVCFANVSRDNVMLILNKYSDTNTVAYGSPIASMPIFNSIPQNGIFASNLPNATTTYTVRVKSNYGCTNNITAQTTRITCDCPTGYCEPATIVKTK